MAAKKKATKKKSSKKKAAKKKGTKKKSAKKKTARKKKKTTAKKLAGNLPKSLTAFGKELRRDLNAIEREIESAGRDARRGLTRVMRDASHQLGVLEARGQKEWRNISKKAQTEIERTVKRVKRAANR